MSGATLDGRTAAGWHFWGPTLYCQRFAYFANVMHLVPLVTPPALRTGLLIHAGREGLATKGADYTAYVRQMGRHIDSDGRVSRYPADEQKAIQIVARHARREVELARGRRDYVRVLAAENEVVCTFTVEGVRIPYTVRYDRIGRWFSRGHDAGIWAIENKSIYDIRGNPTTQFLLDGQITGQYVAWQQARREARAAGRRPLKAIKGVLLDFISKAPPRGKTRITAATPLRHPLPPPSEWKIQGWLYSLRYARETMDRLKTIPESRVHTVPQAISQTICVGKYGRCRYFDLCHNGLGWKTEFRREKYVDRTTPQSAGQRKAA